MANKQVNQVIVGTVLTLAMLTACAKDRTLDDYNRDQLKLELARMAPALGQYSGTVTAQSGATIGALTLSVNTDSVNTDGGTNAATFQRATLKATAVLTVDSPAQVLFSGGYFDADSGTLRFSQTITQRNGAAAVLNLYGTVSGNMLTGTIDAGYPGQTGTFSLTKTGSASAANDLATSRDNPLPNPDHVQKQYFATYVDQGTGNSTAAFLTFTSHHANSDQEFLDPFLGVRLVDVSLELMGPVNPRPNTGFSITFMNSRYDIAKAIVKGEVGATPTPASGGGSTSGAGTSTESHAAFLQCSSVSIPAGQGWKCNYFQLKATEFTNLIFVPYVAPAAKPKPFSESLE